jgi:hypothetical protein
MMTMMDWRGIEGLKKQRRSEMDLEWNRNNVRAY